MRARVLNCRRASRCASRRMGSFGWFLDDPVVELGQIFRFSLRAPMVRPRSWPPRLPTALSDGLRVAPSFAYTTTWHGLNHAGAARARPMISQGVSNANLQAR